MRGERPAWVQQLHQEYGPVVHLSPSEVDFCSISAAKQIHRFRAPFLKSNFYTNLRGNSIVADNAFTTTDLVYHARHRRLLSGPISKSSLKSIEPVVTARVDLAIQKMGEEMKARGCLSFGDSFLMLEIGKKNQYAEDLETVASLTCLRASFPASIRFASSLPFKLPLFHKASESAFRISRHKRIVDADPSNAPPTLLSKLYQAGEEGLSQDEIIAKARTYIIAGSDTTAHSLTYLVWAVCKDDTIKRRLAEEVAVLREGYTDDDLESLPYLNQVLQETLRIYSAAPGPLPRFVPEGGCDIDGYWVPGGLTVTTQAWSMHRDSSVYPDPYRFDPSRWENATKEMYDAWMPFGGSPSNCIGLHLAQKELRLATVRFFQAFPNAKVSSREGFSDDDMMSKCYMLIFPKGKRYLIEGS
ncbi:cytochrome P450 [Bimuria novae-zelandiae CBS 107.79]|uniref:Cytochrome P450 n=1 Tax=Bimuria novae-zelandiae CBS 107.79 TaxID=1447943 RepID=A0A6A5V7V8_9PLEO|nr:cytochrome P450 [Bimuria novae-zelandiae CBS 107.79]